MLCEDRKRRPNQPEWFEARTLPGLTAPVGSSLHVTGGSSAQTQLLPANGLQQVPLHNVQRA